MKGRVSVCIYMYLIIITCSKYNLRAEKYYFDPTLLGDDANKIDLSVFNSGLQQPGNYSVDILINDNIVDHDNINFSIQKDQQGDKFLSPCLTLKQLEKWNIKIENFKNLLSDKNNRNGCINLMQITSIKPELKPGEGKLLLTFPQAAINEIIGNLAPAALWDDGITAFRMNYSFRTSQPIKSVNANKLSSSFLQLTPGFNTGAWRIRNATNWSKYGKSPGQWQYQYTYAERGITAWKSRIKLGELNTNSSIFAATPYIGAQLETDEEMIPDVLRQFSPAITGVVDSHSQIEVRQNGYLIYSTAAEPGPFSIENLNQLGGQGLLEVTIRQDNGKVRQFMVPWQSPAVALHQGYMKYYLMAGKYRPSANDVQNASMLMATIMYGFAKNITGYAGLQHADHYQAFSVGIGKSLGYLGGISLDSTSSQTTLPSANKKQGQQWRIRYNNFLSKTGSTISITRTQNMVPDFFDINGALNLWKKNNLSASRHFSQDTHSTTFLTLSQPAGWLGYFNLNASKTNFYHSGSNLSYGFGWGKNIFNASLSFDWSRNINIVRNAKNVVENQFSLMFSMPFSMASNNNTIQWSMNKNGNSPQTQQVDIRGGAFDNNLFWDISQQYDNSEVNKNYSRSVYISWQTPYTNMSTTYSQSKQSSRLTANMSGGLLLHRHGLTLGKFLSDTVAVAAAPGAYSTPILGVAGSKTDLRGYGIINYLSNYKTNEINLDVTRLPANVQLINNKAKRLIPTQGAILQTTFKTVSGAKALIILTDMQGHSLPFGAKVSLKDNDNINAFVDDGGEVYLSGLPDNGDLIAFYGENKCMAHYVIPEKKADIYKIKSVCKVNKNDKIPK